jgi:hypothetical protein
LKSRFYRPHWNHYQQDHLPPPSCQIEWETCILILLDHQQCGPWSCLFEISRLVSMSLHAPSYLAHFFSMLPF